MRLAKRDACLWAVLSAALLVVMPVGFISADGVGLAARLATGRWTPNPNHLLLEPLSALALSASALVAPERLAVDRLRWLSALAGALSVALFRFGLASRFADSRSTANYATAWMALGAAFSRLWVSAECHIIQMPAVVLATILFCRLRERSRFVETFVLGAAIGVAALCFASLAMLLPFAWFGLAMPSRRGSRSPAWSSALTLAIGFALTAGVAWLTVWWGSVGEELGFVDWLRSYAGAGDLGRLRSVYGAPVSLGGLLVAAARAAYGAACALVDLTPSVAGWRDAGQLWQPLARIVAALATGIALASGFRNRRKDWLGLALLLVAPVMLFGWAWNNSDDQFYLPLAIVFGALAGAAASGPRWIVAMGVFGILWNAADLVHRFVLYPRAERIAELSRAVRDSCLVVHPGFGEAEVLLALGGAPPAAEVLSIAELAVAFPAENGLVILRTRVDRCLASGREVAFVNVHDQPPFSPPWKFLRPLGYDPVRVGGALAGLEVEAPAEPRGNFIVRHVRPAG